MSLVEHHIRVAYQELGNEVSTALQTQIGDAARLEAIKRRCLQFMRDIQQVFLRFYVKVYIHYSLFL